MTPKTQSVCKHCGFTVEDHPVRYQRDGYCGKFEPVAEPASTGEPPPIRCSFCAEGNKPGLLGSGTGNYWHRLDNGELHKCNRNWFKERAARPSEPSAPQTSAVVITNETAMPQASGAIWLRGQASPKEVAEQSAEPLKCQKCTEPLRPSQISATGYEQHVCPAVPQPVAGEGPQDWNTPEFAELAMGFAKIGEMLKGPERHIMNQIKKVFDEIDTERAAKLAEGTPKLEEAAQAIAVYAKHLFSFAQTPITQKEAEIVLRPFITPACSPDSAFKTLREDLGNVECASYEQARRINVALDKFEKALLVATPASTTRKWIDALGDYRNDLARDLTCQEGAAFKAGFLAATPSSTGANGCQHIPEYLSEVGNTYCKVCKVWLWAGQQGQGTAPSSVPQGPDKRDLRSALEALAQDYKEEVRNAETSFAYMNAMEVLGVPQAQGCNCIAMALSGNGPMMQDCPNPDCQYYAGVPQAEPPKTEGK